MPIYEFYCEKCHMLFNFFSRTINTGKMPPCPRCGKPKLERRMSVFANLKRREEENENPMPDLDEGKLEKAMGLLEREMANVDENDPRQAARLMRRLSDMTGMDMGAGMEEALNRMEAGEDPEKIEAEMGDILESEEPFSVRKRLLKASRQLPPRVDATLYEL